MLSLYSGSALPTSPDTQDCHSEQIVANLIIMSAIYSPLLVFAAIYCSVCFANEKGIKITQEGDQIFLEAKTCGDIKTEVAAYRRWSESRGEIPPKMEIDCHKTPHLNKIEITSQVPQFVAQ